jgi:hypothetical protein
VRIAAESAAVCADARVAIAISTSASSFMASSPQAKRNQS